MATVICIGAIIAVFDPDSMDPGEPQIALMVMGPMGFLSGIAFGILLSIMERGAKLFDLPVARAASWGVLGSAVVQLGYLNHGDQGLAANLEMAMVFSVFGGAITVIWLLIGRLWSHRRSARAPRSP